VNSVQVKGYWYKQSLVDWKEFIQRDKSLGWSAMWKCHCIIIFHMLAFRYDTIIHICSETDV